ncbi:MAG: DNA mismatch repair endonuclease MutL, partial [Elusimicrobiota bacterium]|nr:DNA mismatch repair endonuclease MutL [Elusimicrobiota bacterium]
DAKYNFKAFISPASQLTAARDEQFFFINRRPLSAKILQQAVYRAYQPYRAKDKHPIVVLFMQMPPDEFDVNIHPQKKEIKFVAESEVFNFLQRKLSSAILSQSGAEQINLAAVAAQNNTAALPPASKEPVNIPPVPPLYGFNDTADATQPATTAEALSLLLNANIENKATTFEMRDFEDPKKYNIEPTLSDGSFCYPKNDTAIEPTTSASEELAHETADKNTPAWWRPPYNYIGQLHKSYLLFENPQGLVLVDQHAAQERVFFEEYLNSLENKNTERQPLMFPLTVQMAASQIENLLAWQDFLEQAGFEISRFSAGSLLVNSVPNILKFKDEALKDFILQFAAVAGNPNKASKELKYKLIATMACKKSIKAGEQLEREQAAALMQNLKNCDDGLHCPHGRPTLLVLSMEEISKKIGRG